MPNDLLSLLHNIREEVKIPLVVGCEIKVAREMPVGVRGEKQVVPPPSNWICRDKRGTKVMPSISP